MVQTTLGWHLACAPHDESGGTSCRSACQRGAAKRRQATARAAHRDAAAQTIATWELAEERLVITTTTEQRLHEEEALAVSAAAPGAPGAWLVLAALGGHMARRITLSQRPHPCPQDPLSCQE